ncbi:MAG: hypothetical protein Fur0042_12520 [Cyanophyceae cyanobacterium]
MAETLIPDIFPTSNVSGTGDLVISLADLPGIDPMETSAERIIAAIILQCKNFFTEAKRVTDSTKSIVVDNEIRLSAEPFYDPVTNLPAGNFKVQEITFRFYSPMPDSTFDPNEF